ncbi:hypothetical protein KJ742_06980 [Patescibacteria group bacterium]|nr:hypothetical protein [Patescibacteria group bacterium]MBU1683656.1 hypothetical protein [Patescibacteria group bacterium]MBU1934794.1 hypothetical protein [Patescibacteria group bacterium]
MNAELTNGADTGPRVRELPHDLAVILKTRYNLSPDTTMYSHPEGGTVFVKQVIGGVNIILGSNMWFVGDNEMEESRKSGVLAMLNECTELRIPDSAAA